MKDAGLSYEGKWISQPFKIVPKLGGDYLSFDNTMVQVGPYWEDARVSIYKNLIKAGFVMTVDKELRDKFFDYIAEERKHLRNERGQDV